jgi:hypothetical protein
LLVSKSWLLSFGFFIGVNDSLINC